MNDLGFDFTLHWLSMTFIPGDVPDLPGEVRALAERHIKGLFLQDFQRGGLGYENAAGWLGVRLYWGGNNCTVHLSLSGEHSGAFTLPELRAFFADAREKGLTWHFTRLDLAFDVEGLDIAEVDKAVQAGNLRTYAKRETFRKQEHYIGHGTTIYIGSRTSERMLRIYDERGPIRFELEVKGKSADIIGGLLLDDRTLSDGWDYIRTATAFLRDYVDFHATFWRVFTALERAFLRLTDPRKSSMTRAQENIEKRLAATIAALVAINGREWLEDTLDRARIPAERKMECWGYSELVPSWVPSW